MQDVEIKIINKSTNQLPEYQSIGSAGVDLRASLDEDITLNRCNACSSQLAYLLNCL